MMLRRPGACALLALVSFGLLLFGAACAPAAPAVPSGAAGAAAPPRAAARGAATSAPGSAAPARAEGGGAQASAPAATVKVGVVRTLTEAGIYVGLERGYFAEQGITLDLENFDTAAKAVPAVSTDQVDISSGVLSAGLFNAIDRGVDIKITGPVSRQEADLSSNVILVRKDLVDSGAVRTYADLKGRPFAAPTRGSTIEYALDLAMKRDGLTADDLDWVDLGFPDQLPAFANHAIDAGYNTEPTPTIAANQGLAVKWRRVGDWAPGLQFTVLMYAPQFAQERNAVARCWMVAYLKGLRDYMDAVKKGIDKPALFEILARNTTLKDMSLYDQVGWANLDPNGRMNLESLDDQARWYFDKGLIRTLPDLKRIVDLQYVDYARGVLGEYQ